MTLDEFRESLSGAAGLQLAKNSKKQLILAVVMTIDIDCCWNVQFMVEAAGVRVTFDALSAATRRYFELLSK